MKFRDLNIFKSIFILYIFLFISCLQNNSRTIVKLLVIIKLITKYIINYYYNIR